MLKTALVLVAVALEFEAASVRVSREPGRRFVSVTPTSITMTNVTLRDCLAEAYGLGRHQVAGPSWITENRYSVAAKSSAPVETGTMKTMLQALLIERFGLAIHREKRRLSAYVLRVGRGTLRLKRDDNRDSVVPTGRGLMFQGMTMTEFVEQFLSGVPVFEFPVLNLTGLDGRFTFTLNLLDEVSAADVKSQVAAGGPDMFVRALEAIGLTLTVEKLAMETLVVDRARPIPADN